MSHTTRMGLLALIAACTGIAACGGGNSASGTAPDGGTTPPASASPSGYSMAIPSYFLAAAGISGSAQQGYSVELDPSSSSPGHLGIVVITNTAASDKAIAFASSANLFPLPNAAWSQAYGAYGADIFDSLGVPAAFFTNLGAQPCGTTIAAGASCVMALIDGDSASHDATFTLDGATVTVHLSAPIGTPGAPPSISLAGGSYATPTILSQADSDALKAAMPRVNGSNPATAQIDLGSIPANDPAANPTTSTIPLTLTNTGSTSIHNMSVNLPAGEGYSVQFTPTLSGSGCTSGLPAGASTTCSIAVSPAVPGSFATPIWTFDAYSTNPSYPSGGALGITTVKWTVQAPSNFRPVVALSYSGQPGSSTGTLTVTNNGTSAVLFTGGAVAPIYQLDRLLTATSGNFDTSDCDNQPGGALQPGASCSIALLNVVSGGFYNFGMVLPSVESNPADTTSTNPFFYYYGNLSGTMP